MIKKLEPLRDEVEQLKRQGRQTLLLVKTREKRGEDTTEIWREQGLILNKLSTAYEELSYQLGIRIRFWSCLEVVAVICFVYFTYQAIMDLIAVLEYST